MAPKTASDQCAASLAAEALSYRQPMRVAQILVLSAPFGESGWPICPRCDRTIDREYMSYCDRCGQRLDWRRYKEAELVYPGRR